MLIDVSREKKKYFLTHGDARFISFSERVRRRRADWKFQVYLVTVPKPHPEKLMSKSEDYDLGTLNRL